MRSGLCTAIRSGVGSYADRFQSVVEADVKNTLKLFLLTLMIVTYLYNFFIIYEIFLVKSRTFLKTEKYPTETAENGKL